MRYYGGRVVIGIGNGYAEERKMSNQASDVCQHCGGTLFWSGSYDDGGGDYGDSVCEVWECDTCENTTERNCISEESFQYLFTEQVEQIIRGQGIVHNSTSDPYARSTIGIDEPPARIDEDKELPF